MGLSLLVVNAGSSSVKLALFPGAAAQESAVQTLPGDTSPSDLVRALRALAGRADAGEIAAVGHRVVHGGTELRQSALIGPEVLSTLAQLEELAPLHNKPALAGIDAAREAIPHARQVAVFDTAFYSNLPPRAFVYPLPWEWTEDWGIRRFGFHGISHRFVTERAGQMLGREGDRALRLVSAHLGSGCSATACRGGEAVATTMGFTPLEGLMMATRSGSIDPGALLHVQKRHGLSADALEDVLQHRSGLLGVSGVSSDYRKVEEAARAGNGRARLALTLYADRVRSAVGSLAVALGGVDALIFTAGVGENSASLRAEVCEGLSCLGLMLDPQRNEAAAGDADVAAASSPGRILVVKTHEERLIARETRGVLGRESSS